MFGIHRVRITKDNIGKFHSKDSRVRSDRFIKEQKWLENEIANFVKHGDEGYPERYDLTVMTFDHNKDPWFIVDGSHRTEALKVLLEQNEIKSFNVILIPDISIPTRLNNIREQISKQNELLNKMLKKEDLPIWIKKYDIEEKDGKWIGWNNTKAIDSGGKDMTMVSIPEYQKTREKQ